MQIPLVPDGEDAQLLPQGHEAVQHHVADSMARVTQVLVSAAGALANYNVSEVPVPAVGWLVGTALAGCAVRGRRARSCPQPPSTS